MITMPRVTSDIRPLLAAEDGRAPTTERARAVVRRAACVIFALPALVLASCALAPALASARRGARDDMPRVGLQPAATDGGGNYSFCRPDPNVLVWDEDFEQLVRARAAAVLVKGWLSVPLVHERELLAPIGLESPRVALRVAGYSDCAPKARAPLLTHCGGPGSGNDCLSIANLLPTLSPALDNFAISQRGVIAPRSDRRPPPVPFRSADGRERVRAFPTITCYTSWATPIIDTVRRAYEDARLDPAPLDALLATYARAGGGGEELMLYNATLIQPYAHLLAASAAECRSRAEFRSLGAARTDVGPPDAASDGVAAPTLAPANGAPASTVFDSELGGHESLLDFASTTDLARDIDALRAAVGSARISIWGTSYGTVVGGAYATMFSDRVEALVLDGNVGVENDIYKVGEKLALSYDDVWNGLCSACDASYFVAGERAGRKCAAAPYANEKILKLMAQPARVPGLLRLLKSTLDRGITGRGIAPAAAIAMACIESLSTRGDYTGPGCCAAELEADVLPTPADEWEDRLSIIQVVRALDIAGRLNPAQIARFYVELGLRHPLGAQGASNVIFIASSPTLPRPTPPFGSPIVTPLIIGTLNDPATTFAAAQDMKAFFPQGTLLTWQGFLHGFRIVDALPARDAAASDELRFANGGYGAYVCTQLLKAYLVSGELPRDGTTCPIDGPGASALALDLAVAHAGRGKGQVCL
ncbi:hypothetical protein KFE25_013648 [Diacronema lutheri]|uniref:AB hydrolase-1 domain-containing protein n=1 Tax=Diacronema lutheri TaxID=2081491 RepID=A0A8J5XZS3_DIALT|nr:hypothetical protein KFE25_013648 [Diacronema lutheri]